MSDPSVGTSTTNGERKLSPTMTPEELAAAESAGGIYEEVEIEDMELGADGTMYYFPCPCGDRFQISVEDLKYGEDIAYCPSCSLKIRVIYDEEEFWSDATDD